MGQVSAAYGALRSMPFYKAAPNRTVLPLKKRKAMAAKKKELDKMRWVKTDSINRSKLESLVNLYPIPKFHWAAQDFYCHGFTAAQIARMAKIKEIIKVAKDLYEINPSRVSSLPSLIFADMLSQTSQEVREAAVILAALKKDSLTNDQMRHLIFPQEGALERLKEYINIGREENPIGRRTANPRKRYLRLAPPDEIEYYKNNYLFINKALKKMYDYCESAAAEEEIDISFQKKTKSLASGEKITYIDKLFLPKYKENAENAEKCAENAEKCAENAEKCAENLENGNKSKFVTEIEAALEQGPLFITTKLLHEIGLKDAIQGRLNKGDLVLVEKGLYEIAPPKKIVNNWIDKQWKHENDIAWEKLRKEKKEKAAKRKREKAAFINEENRVGDSPPKRGGELRIEF